MSDNAVSSLNKKSHKLWDLAADVLAKFLAGKHNANLLNILVHLQLLRFHNAYHFKALLHLLPFSRNLKGEFGDPQFCG